MGKTSIEWATDVWNPVTGCQKVSEGCRNCCAKALHDMRHKAFLAGKKVPAQYAQPFEVVQMHPDRLELISRWRKPRRIFVNSMSDLFHPDVPDEFIWRVFKAMSQAPWHIFMILTKRADRMSNLVNKIRSMLPDRLEHVWTGASIEDQVTADIRIPYLLRTHASVRFVSCEPLLGPVDLGFPFVSDNPFMSQTGLDWVIAGGESGPNARPMHPDWARSLRDQCRTAGVPFFFKQWGEFHYDPLNSKEQGRVYMDATGKVFTDRGSDEDYRRGRLAFDRVGKKAAGRVLDGQEWNQFPGDPT
jgi:protein gp37